MGNATDIFFAVALMLMIGMVALLYWWASE